MLSKEDYGNYLDQVSQLEQRMRDLYTKCRDKVEDNSVKETCHGLLNAEQRHDLIVKELKSIIIS